MKHQLALLAAAAAVTAAPAQEKPKLSYPLIRGHGGVVAAPDGAQGPRAGTKIVVDLTAGKTEKGVNAGLSKVARFVNLYAARGVKSGGGVKFAVVIHGDATGCVVGGEANRGNGELMGRLKAAGVEFLVCAQSLAHSGHKPGEVMEPVRVAYSGLTALANLQADGYSYVPLK